MILKRFITYLLFITLINISIAQSEDFNSGAEYLQTAIRDIIIKNSEHNIHVIDNPPRFVTVSPLRRIVTASLHLNGNRRFSGGEAPQLNAEPSLTLIQDNQAQATNHDIPDPPPLTKGELAALYEAAISAGRVVHMSPNMGGNMHGLEDSLPIQAAVHEIRDHHQQNNALDASNSDSYYYYYYPLKTFLDGIPTQVPKPTQVVPRDHYKSPVLTSFNTHMHNVKVEPIKTVTEQPEKGSKSIEPLFMMISSFVGMAVMFVFSMVLLPRLTAGIKGGKGRLKKNPKKARFLQDSFSLPDMDWPNLIRGLIDSYCTVDCPDNSLLNPYRYKLMNARSRMRK